MKTNVRMFLVALLFTLSLLYRVILNSKKSSPQIWVSLSVCWPSQPGEMSMKFPYHDLAKFSAKLWKVKTRHKVVLHIIADPSEVSSPGFLDYVQSFRNICDIVKVVPVESEGLECAERSTLQRLFAFKDRQIQEEDVIVMSDVDAYVVSPDIFDEIEFHLDRYQVWILNYDYQMNYGVRMCFLAMKAGVWRQLLPFDSPEGLIWHFRKILANIPEANMFNSDQVIMSYMLVHAQLCNFPPQNEIWTFLNLEERAEMFQFDDSRICYHGIERWWECHGNMRNKLDPDKCRWYHFTNKHLGHEEAKRLYLNIIKM